MTTTENFDPKRYWPDANGSLIPVDKIKPIDKARHQLAVKMIEQAKQMSETLRQFKLAAATSMEAFIQQSAEEYGAKVGGKKGNVTITSFDGRFKVERHIQDSIVFDERLQVAKTLIDDCIHVWAKGSNKNIQALVNQAFQVDKENKVNTGAVLALRRHKIDDPQWAKAMEAIADSMQTSSSKPYLRFYEKNQADEWVAIHLNIAAI